MLLLGNQQMLTHSRPMPGGRQQGTPQVRLPLVVKEVLAVVWSVVVHLLVYKT
jgi:hypothetical protein